MNVVNQSERGKPFSLFRQTSCAAVLLLLLGNMLYAQAVSPVLSLSGQGAGDQDDMCIWIHPGDPSLSTIITSDKDASRVFVYDLSGNTLQTINTDGSPGGIDVRYNFVLSGQPVDIVGYNDRDNTEIVILTVNPSTRQLTQVANFDAGGGWSELYGFCLYVSPNTGKHYAIGCGKSGQIRQWELVDNGNGSIDGIEKRTWDNGTQTEGMVADDETAKLYAASETDGVYKYDADPTDPTPSGDLIAPTGSNGLTEDVEGVAIYYAANGEGYLIVSSQGNSTFKVYERKEPHDFVKTFSVNGASDTDGIDVTNVNLGPAFPNGLFTLHEGSTAVLMCDYEDLGLQIDTEYWNPRNSGVSAIEPEPGLLSQFSLSQNYPNPFNPSTSIRFTLGQSAAVELSVYDVAGREVSKLVDEFRTAGSYTYSWSATDANGALLPSGIYFAHLRAGAYKSAIKMILAR